MAIELIQIKDGNFPKTSTIDGTGLEYIVVSKADGITYAMLTSDFKAFLGTVQVQVPKALAPSDPVPVLAGVYIPTVNGTYPDGIVVDLSDGYNQLIFDGSTWSKVVSPIDLEGYLKNNSIETNNLVSKVTLFPDKQVLIATGIEVDNPMYVATDFIPLSDSDSIKMTRGINSAQSIAFYNSSKVFISSISGGSGSVTTIQPPSGTAYGRSNPSTDLSTRTADIAAFGIYQKSSASGSFVEKIEGVGIIASDVTDRQDFVIAADVITNVSDNIYSIGMVEDNTYVHSSGSIGTGSALPATDFAMARVPIQLKKSNKISWLRQSTTGTLGAFFTQNMIFISSISGVGSVLSGTSDIPEKAAWFFANVSSNPLSRESDKNNFILVYGNEIPTEKLPQTTTKAIKGHSLSHPYSGLKLVATGDSITTYERIGSSGQNPLSNYIVRASSEIGMILVENSAIGGSTIGQNASDPEGRNPISVRYTEMNDDADLVIIAAGTNDCTHNWVPLGSFTDTTVNTFYGALHVLCSGLKGKYVGKQILFLTPIKRYYPDGGMTTPDSENAGGYKPVQFVDAIIEVCAWYGIPVLDMYRTCILNPFIGSYRIAYMSDGTHPNADGHIIMKNRLVNFLRQL